MNMLALLAFLKKKLEQLKNYSSLCCCASFFFVNQQKPF